MSLIFPSTSIAFPETKKKKSAKKKKKKQEKKQTNKKTTGIWSFGKCGNYLHPDSIFPPNKENVSDFNLMEDTKQQLIIHESKK